MSDFAFIDNPPREIDRIAQRKQHYAALYRDALKRQLKLVADHCEEAQDHCRQLIRANEDVSEELDELETTARALLLVALILKRETVNG